MTDPTDELPAALELLRKSTEKPGAFDRRVVRAVLVPLGELLRTGDPADLEPVVAEVRELVEPVEKAWREALEFELQLAASEHVQAVDLRYLNHPGYDFPYTLAARERLEARFVAAEALGLPADASLVENVRRADAVLEPYLRSREGGEPLN